MRANHGCARAPVNEITLQGDRDTPCEWVNETVIYRVRAALATWKVDGDSYLQPASKVPERLPFYQPLKLNGKKPVNFLA